MYKLFLPLLILLTFQSCAVFNTSYEIDKSVNFSNYKTFAWLVKQPVRYENNFFYDTLDNHIKSIVRKELLKRGLQVDTANPDLILDFYFKVEQKMALQQVPQFGHLHNYEKGYRENGYNYQYHGINSNRYRNQGVNTNSYNDYSQREDIVGYKTEEVEIEKDRTLSIMVIDLDSNKLVWKGCGIEIVSDLRTYEKDIKKGIPEIFKNFPILDTLKKNRKFR